MKRDINTETFGFIDGFSIDGEVNSSKSEKFSQQGILISPIAINQSNELIFQFTGLYMYLNPPSSMPEFGSVNADGSINLDNWVIQTTGWQ